MLKTALVLIGLTGCSQSMVLSEPTSGSVHTYKLSMAEARAIMTARSALTGFELPVHPFERPVTVAVWRGHPDHAAPVEDDTPDPLDRDPDDPTSTLHWPAPPATVGCVVRGAQDPFPDVCGPALVTVHHQGEDIALMDPTTIEVVWGIPRRQSRASGLWVHGRAGGISVTGHARKPMKFALKREIMVVKDHVWVKKEAPVSPQFADNGVFVAIQDDVSGVEDIRAMVGCDDLSFDALDATAAVEPTPVSEPQDQPDPVFAYALGSTLTLLTEPNGATVTKLNALAEHSIDVELVVKETRGAFTRVAFETLYARFDVWVANREIGDAMSHGLGSRSYGGCGRSGYGGSFSTLSISRASSLHLGKDTADKRPAVGLLIAAGAEVLLGESKDGYTSVIPYGSPIMPAGELRFWIPDTALENPSLSDNQVQAD